MKSQATLASFVLIALNTTGQAATVRLGDFPNFYCEALTGEAAGQGISLTHVQTVERAARYEVRLSEGAAPESWVGYWTIDNYLDPSPLIAFNSAAQTFALKIDMGKTLREGNLSNIAGKLSIEPGSETQPVACKILPL